MTSDAKRAWEAPRHTGPFLMMDPRKGEVAITSLGGIE